MINPVMHIANQCIEQSTFPEKMKMANITPVFKKKDKLNKVNYRSINLLTAFSKILEKLLFNQIYEYMKSSFRHVFLPLFGCPLF